MKKRLNLFIILLLVSVISFLPYKQIKVSAEERQAGRLVDAAHLLTESQSEDLTKKLDEISIRQNLDLVVITADALEEGYTPAEYADAVFDYYGYGMGDNYDGILLLLSMEERDWALSTHGFGISAFTDAGQKYMVDKMGGYLSEGDFNGAFNIFADIADEFITQAKNGIAYDNNKIPEKSQSPFLLPVSVIGGALIGFGITGSMKSKLKSVSKQRMASKYLTDTAMLPYANKDLYLYSLVTKTEKPKEKEKSGGSTSHKSSSGKTHGGSSGKF